MNMQATGQTIAAPRPVSLAKILSQRLDDGPTARERR